MQKSVSLEYEPSSKPLHNSAELFFLNRELKCPPHPRPQTGASAGEERDGGGIHPHPLREREFFIDNTLVRIHSIIVMITWTGPAPWEFEFPSPGSLVSTFLARGLKFLALPQSILAHQFSESGPFLAPKLTNLYCNPGMST